MIIKNTIDKELKVQIKQNNYTLPAKGEISIPLDDAIYWRSMLHTFLVIEPESKDEETLVVKELMEGQEKEEEKVERKTIENKEEEIKEKESETITKLEDLTRPELDKIAKEIGLNPEDYPNKAKLIEALTQ